MRVFLGLAAMLTAAACGSDDLSSTTEPRPLVFERWSPPQASSYDVFVAARGNLVLMASRISRDGGATWAALDPRVGTLGRVSLDDGGTVFFHTPQLGLARWDLASGAVTAVPGAPPFAGERTWRRDRASGRFVAFDPVENTVAVERPGSWMTASLPRPAPTELRPYITDLESNGSTLLAVSGWGVHRSTDAGATWQLAAAAPLAGAGRDLIVLGDGRFALVGGATAYAFTAAGAAAGTLPGLVVGDDEASVCDDGSISGSISGSIVARGRVSRDAGATWRPLAEAGDLDLVIERAGCGAGSYWVLVRSDAWGYRLLRYAEAGAPGIAVGNWDAVEPQAWTAGGPSIVRIADGTFLAGGLAWREGDATWTLREMPAKTWTSGGTLLGTAGGGFFASTDAGIAWTALPAAGLTATEPESFARGADGALYVGQFTGATAGTTDTWRSTVWRSSDTGATWSAAYTGVATRLAGEDVMGEAHRFVGISATGAWIATGAVSVDAGATWQATEAVGDRSLAHLMPDGSLVMQPADSRGEIWRVYADAGLGPLLGTHAIEADGEPVLAAELRSVAFDDAGHAYIARGAPHVQIWRTTTPVN